MNRGVILNSRRLFDLVARRHFAEAFENAFGGILRTHSVFANNTNCFYYRFIFNCGIWFIGTTPIFIIFERYLATRKITNYQDDKKYGIILIIAQIMLSGLFLSMLYDGYIFGTDQLRVYCMASNPSMSFYKSSSLLGIIFSQLLAVFGLKYLIRKNLKIRKIFKDQGVHLLKRYQVEETLRSLNTLKQPIYTMFISQFSFTSMSFFGQRYGSGFSQEVYYTILESSVLLPEYSVIFVLLFIRNNEKINRERKSHLNQKIMIEPEEYFNHYKNVW
ncbi:unnamed protein product [Caenorhabditis angaria]|uniref:Uncharacterized protein n=1 Tax=Caenorhabditis angaria TaxID=860376 RepID=A0A9P1N2J8_9PELO|nr:unnamed protein product [Caenorhabditis angaria]